MSTVTNLHGISAAVVAAMAGFERAYSKGGADYSATDLIKPAWMSYLQRKHHQDIVRDVSDSVPSFIGNAVHGALAGVEHSDGALIEQRFSAVIAGVTVSGAVDYALPPVVRDYKVCKAYKVKKIMAGEPGAIDEWEQQLNEYAMLIRMETGAECYDLAIEAIISDWSKAEAARDPGYPQCAWQLIRVECWPDDDQVAWVERQIAEREALGNADGDSGSWADGGPAECPPEQRWEKPATFAVMKGKNKRATKLCDTLIEAESYIAAHKDGAQMRVEERPADPVRCRDWCNVNFACPFWQAHEGSKA